MGRRELSSLTRTSKLIRGYVLPLLYRDLEISLIRCSDPNYNLLFRTISENQRLANLVKSITIDLNPRLERDLLDHGSFDTTDLQGERVEPPLSAIEVGPHQEVVMFYGPRRTVFGSSR